MKNTFLLTSLLFLLMNVAHAQSDNAPGVTVTGEGILFVKPDRMVVMLDVQAEAMEFGDATAALEKKTGNIAQYLEKKGYNREDLKILNFGVNKNYDYPNGRKVDKGYSASNNIRLEMPYNTKNLDKLASVLSESPEPFTFNLSFTLSDEKRKEIKSELLTMAVKDAREKAEILINAADHKLGSLKNIQYTSGNNGPMPMYDNMRMEAAQEMKSAIGGMEVRDMQLTENVTVTYHIM